MRVCIEIENAKGQNIIVASIYRAPNTDLALLNTHIENICNNSKKKTVYLCGDFNVDLLKYDTHGDTSNFIDQLYSHGLHPLINRPTRITRTSASIIDNIFTNELQISQLSGLLINDLSDHLPNFQICKYTNEALQNKNRHVLTESRQMNADNFESFYEALALEDWDEVINSDDVNNAYN